MNQRQIEKLFDIICDSQQNKVVTVGGVSMSPGQARTFVRQKIQAFELEPASIVGNKKIQAFYGSSETPEITTREWNAFQPTQNYDTLWQEAFRSVPLRRGQLSWTIGDVTAGTTFQLLTEGQKVEFEGVSGTTATVSVNLYGAGLQMTWQTYEGRDLAAFFNAMQDFQAKRQELYADVHYGLLNTAAATNTVSWQGSGTNLERDIATINFGAYSLADDNKDSGYGDMANAQMLLYISPKYRSRMEAAFRSVQTDLTSAGNSGEAIRWNVVPRYTFNSNITADKGVLVLPGRKIQNSMYMVNKSFEKIDESNLAWLKTEFTAFGAAVGDNDQCYQLSFS